LTAPDAPESAAPAPAGAQASELPAKVARLREQLMRREFAAVLEAARALRLQHPGSRDVLYILAIGLRCLGRIPEALETLQELESRYPSYARLFEERGQCYLAQGALDPALAALTKAVELNPWLPGSARALESLCRMRGRLPEAEAAARLAVSLESLPKEISTAHSLFTDGEIRAAEQLVRQYLRTRGDHVEGMRLLARIAMVHEAAYDAEVLLENALRLAPDYHAARYEYAEALSRRLKHHRAREELEKLLAIDPENRAYRLAHANACARLGDYEQALPAYRRLLRETPQDEELLLAVGFALKTLGRAAEAIDSYRAAAALRPACGPAYWSLADLKTYRFEDPELEQMIRYEADAGTSLVDRYFLSFALGRALEDRGEYERSFRYYQCGNELKRREIPYDPAIFESLAQQQALTCTREFFAARTGWGYPDAAPIFIVGLPRAGSTLIEQILASHSQVDGTMELPTILHLISDLHYRSRLGDKPRYPAVLADLSREDCARLGEKYIRDSLVYRRGKPFFIDKWSSNFRDLGFIRLILPNARIIDARREAIACCFGNFKQLFPARSGPQFTYRFEEIARYYRMYLELMRHWDEVLPGKRLRVEHEALVTDFEANVRRLLAFCGLEPEAACFEFYKTERAVYSSSSEQVRQPINRESLEQWRHFEPWLGPLKEALER
jgi:tetratricopeptide (TPR) repeat protein